MNESSIKSRSAKALTWGRAQRLPHLARYYLSTVTLTLLPQLRSSPGTAECEDTSRLEARQGRFSYAIDWPIRRWRAALSIDFLLFSRGDLWERAWYNLSSDKRVLELKCEGGGQFTKMGGEKFCERQADLWVNSLFFESKGTGWWAVSSTCGSNQSRRVKFCCSDGHLEGQEFHVCHNI